ncbi:hypothetical protein [Duganella aceris]|uniref:Lipoprotein n=1 Tax=Duganella aceris TaxID=2703883 RepID=A0ABX0FQZ7_9BURK|nr:hypothetical protein [Duganella aceris]NGZ86960.1 hypothetical protein [Duganella aceris]
MKSLYLRSGLALLCAVILSACGGGGGDLALQGVITGNGVGKSGLVLQNESNGEKLPITAGTTAFVFTKLVAVDEKFNITIASQPIGAKCEATENSGTANVYTSYRITITCTANPWTLGGNITGLRGTGLALANGSDTVAVLPPAVANADVSFTFPSKVADGSQFGATVLVQPQGQTCTIDPKNNPGVMPGSDALGLVVNCKNN